MVNSLPPGVIRNIGRFLSTRNVAALASTSRTAREALSRNVKRRRTQNLIRAAGKIYGPKGATSHKFYWNVLRGLNNLKSTPNKGNAQVARRLTNANLNALRRKVVKNMKPLIWRKQNGYNFIWRLANNTHMYGHARMIEGNLPYEAFNVWLYKPQPNGTYARYNGGGYRNRLSAPGHGGRRI